MLTHILPKNALTNPSSFSFSFSSATSLTPCTIMFVEHSFRSLSCTSWSFLLPFIIILKPVVVLVQGILSGRTSLNVLQFSLIFSGMFTKLCKTLNFSSTILVTLLKMSVPTLKLENFISARGAY